jgi:long-chain fatty acid transport protein
MKLIVMMCWCLIAPLSLMAGGFEFTTQNPKTAGMGGSIAGYALDGSAVFYNPAAITFLGKNYFNAGVSIVIPKTAYLGNAGKAEFITNKKYLPFNFYGTYKIKEQTSIGLSINSPFGNGAEWEPNWSGRYIIQKSKFSTINIQPAIAYKISEIWSFGIGPVIVMGTMQQEKSLPVENAIGESTLRLDGKGIGFGVNAGIYRQEDKISLGLSYRSGSTIRINNGTADFNNIPSSLVLDNTYPISTTFSSEFCVPTVISAGVAYQLKETILLTVDYRFYNWKSFGAYKIEYNNFQDLNTTTKNNLGNSFSISAGVQIVKSEKISFRGGVGYDQSPMLDGYLDPRMPDADKFIFSGGLSYELKENFSVDGSFTFKDFKERKGSSGASDNFKGTYKSYQYIIGVGLQYAF